jgi:mannose-1-phosphate guanylyltransferase
MQLSEHTYAVVLAGGGGTRLWPKSRNKTPKQFLRLTSDATMMQVAAGRLAKLVPWERIIVVTNRLHVDEIKKELPEIPPANILAEPEKRETALAMLIGALYAKSLDPEAVIVNSASDHVILDEAEYDKVITSAVEMATSGDFLLTVGITPTRPETGFGYIKVGGEFRQLENGVMVYKVDSFREKPDAQTAAEFLKTGQYYWNANMYVWSVDALIRAFQLHMPETYQLAAPLQMMATDQFHQALTDIYAQAQTISIDYAISEKATNLLLIPGDFGWNDVGDWKVVYELGQKDEHGNVIITDNKAVPTMTLDAENNLIHTSGRMIGLIGVQDLIIVDTGEILLVVPKNRSQDVKKIVEQLKKEDRKEYL